MQDNLTSQTQTPGQAPENEGTQRVDKKIIENSIMKVRDSFQNVFMQVDLLVSKLSQSRIKHRLAAVTANNDAAKQYLDNVKQTLEKAYQDALARVNSVKDSNSPKVFRKEDLRKWIEKETHATNVGVDNINMFVEHVCDSGTDKLSDEDKTKLKDKKSKIKGLVIKVWKEEDLDESEENLYNEISKRFSPIARINLGPDSDLSELNKELSILETEIRSVASFLDNYYKVGGNQTISQVINRLQLELRGIGSILKEDLPPVLSSLDSNFINALKTDRIIPNRRALTAESESRREHNLETQQKSITYFLFKPTESSDSEYRKNFKDFMDVLEKELYEFQKVLDGELLKLNDKEGPDSDKYSRHLTPFYTLADFMYIGLFENIKSAAARGRDQLNSKLSWEAFVRQTFKLRELITQAEKSGNKNSIFSGQSFQASFGSLAASTLFNLPSEAGKVTQSFINDLRRIRDQANAEYNSYLERLSSLGTGYDAIDSEQERKDTIKVRSKLRIELKRKAAAYQLTQKSNDKVITSVIPEDRWRQIDEVCRLYSLRYIVTTYLPFILTGKEPLILKAPRPEENLPTSESTYGQEVSKHYTNVGRINISKIIEDVQLAIGRTIGKYPFVVGRRMYQVPEYALNSDLKSKMLAQICFEIKGRLDAAAGQKFMTYAGRFATGFETNNLNQVKVTDVSSLESYLKTRFNVQLLHLQESLESQVLETSASDYQNRILKLLKEAKDSKDKSVYKECNKLYIEALKRVGMLYSTSGPLMKFVKNLALEKTSKGSSPELNSSIANVDSQQGKLKEYEVIRRKEIAIYTHYHKLILQVLGKENDQVGDKQEKVVAELRQKISKLEQKYRQLAESEPETIASMKRVKRVYAALRIKAEVSTDLWKEMNEKVETEIAKYSMALDYQKVWCQYIYLSTILMSSDSLEKVKQAFEAASVEATVENNISATLDDVERNIYYSTIDAERAVAYESLSEQEQHLTTAISGYQDRFKAILNQVAPAQGNTGMFGLGQQIDQKIDKRFTQALSIVDNITDETKYKRTKILPTLGYFSNLITLLKEFVIIQNEFAPKEQEQQVDDEQEQQVNDEQEQQVNDEQEQQTQELANKKTAQALKQLLDKLSALKVGAVEGSLKQVLAEIDQKIEDVEAISPQEQVAESSDFYDDGLSEEPEQQKEQQQEEQEEEQEEQQEEQQVSDTKQKIATLAKSVVTLKNESQNLNDDEFTEVSAKILQECKDLGQEDLTDTEKQQISIVASELQKIADSRQAAQSSKNESDDIKNKIIKIWKDPLGLSSIPNNDNSYFHVNGVRLEIETWAPSAEDRMERREDIYLPPILSKTSVQALYYSYNLKGSKTALLFPTYGYNITPKMNSQAGYSYFFNGVDGVTKKATNCNPAEVEITGDSVKLINKGEIL